MNFQLNDLKDIIRVFPKSYKIFYLRRDHWHAEDFMCLYDEEIVAMARIEGR